MKDPKALFPYLFASSWLGNLLLTVLAFALAFTHEGPLSALTFLTVAACILAGNLLPISAYYLFTRWRAAELRAEAAEATVRVRDALTRSEEVMGRLDEAEGALSKTILIARQIPERIGEKFAAVEALADKLETLEGGSFTEALSGQTELVKSLKEEAGTIRSSIEQIQSGLAALPKSIRQAVEEAVPARSEASSDEADVSLDERLDMVFESLESVQYSLDGLLQRIADLSVPAPPVAAKPDTDEPDDGIEPEAEFPEPEFPDTAGELDETEAPAIIEEPELPEEQEEVEDPAIPEEAEATEAPAEPEESETTGEMGEAAAEDAPATRSLDQAEMALEEPPVAVRETPARGTKGMVQLNVQAMIGISNKLYIRGDEPWLSWDRGQPMDLVGIGEFAWQMNDLKEPIEVSVLLNDELETDSGRLTLEPGKPVRISLSFPRR